MDGPMDEGLSHRQSELDSLRSAPMVPMFESTTPKWPFLAGFAR
jgi:hypothetical protein